MTARAEDHLISIYDGVVYDNLDPMVIGRIRVTIPGLIEPYSAWALPVGFPGAGPGRGLWQPPPVGANVSVMFKEGDPDHPRYFCGPWGAPEGEQPDSPDFVHDLSPSEAVQVAGLQTRRWDIVADDRPGHESLVIRDRLVGQNQIEIDGVAQTVTVSGTVAVQIQSTGVVKIDALQIILNGRVVLPSGNPI